MRSGGYTASCGPGINAHGLLLVFLDPHASLPGRFALVQAARQVDNHQSLTFCCCCCVNKLLHTQAPEEQGSCQACQGAQEPPAEHLQEPGVCLSTSLVVAAWRGFGWARGEEAMMPRSRDTSSLHAALIRLCIGLDLLYMQALWLFCCLVAHTPLRLVKGSSPSAAGVLAKIMLLRPASWSAGDQASTSPPRITNPALSVSCVLCHTPGRLVQPTNKHHPSTLQTKKG